MRVNSTTLLAHPSARRKIQRRVCPLPDQAEQNRSDLLALPPLLQRIYQTRGVESAEALDRSLARLPSPWLLSGMERMVDHLAAAFTNREHILIVADFDADGATSCAVALLGLTLLGANRVSYLVPNRFEYGYGLTPEIVEVAALSNPQVLITVDNGISSLEGVETARSHGMRVLITDHHLPGPELPDADAIVNPNLPGDRFPGRSLAGVGVMFYVLLALRARLRERGWFQDTGIAEANLGQLLDLVALGTVADVVPLDNVNRILVHQGIQRIRSGKARPGILALLTAAGRNPRNITATDLGFCVAPRLNAAGRLEDMALGIECLMSQDEQAAQSMAAELDNLNRERREIEDQMKQDALAVLAQLENTGSSAQSVKAAYCFFDQSWHQGVIGILASRMKDRLHRPVIAFAPAVDDGQIKGSARSIPGLHIRDLLSEIATEHPELLSRFGGHAMAAGLTLDRQNLALFSQCFEEKAAQHLGGVDLDNILHSDGELAIGELQLSSAEYLQNAGPWGQGFPEPLFDGEFEVSQARIVGQKHLKLTLCPVGATHRIDAIAFFVEQPESWLGCSRLKVAYRLDINEYRNNRTVQLRVEYMEKNQAE